MDITASSFTLRKNAKRAAEAMIRKGTAPAVDYGIKPSDDGRFEIVWKSAKTAPTTDEVETEIAEAPANQPAAGSPTIPAAAPACSRKPTSGLTKRSAMRRPPSSPGVPQRRRRKSRRGRDMPSTLRQSAPGGFPKRRRS